MATPTNIDDCSFRVTSQSWGVSFDGADTLTEIQKGAASLLSAADASFTRYSTHGTYTSMYLINKRVDDRGPVAQITLEYLGKKETLDPNSGLIDIVDDVAESSVQLVSDEGENVSFKYYAQQVTYRWMSRQTATPTLPKFSLNVPTSIPTGFLFAPSPAKYDGSFATSYAINARLAGFRRTRLAPELWAVSETWRLVIEPL